MIENVTFTNNVFLKDNFWPKNVLIHPTDFVVGDVKFQNKQDLTINDFTPIHNALVKDKGDSSALYQKRLQRPF